VYSVFYHKSRIKARGNSNFEIKFKKPLKNKKFPPEILTKQKIERIIIVKNKSEGRDA
jgi:hypothetical protein